MTIHTAKTAFAAILRQLNDSETCIFYDWIESSRENELSPSSEGSSRPRPIERQNFDRPILSKSDNDGGKQNISLHKSNAGRLKAIAKDLRKLVPFDGIVKTEQIAKRICDDEECDQVKTLHIDAFLYDEEALDDLVEEGKVSRNFCRKCGSCNTQPIEFISHSMSGEQMEFLFSTALPQIVEAMNTKTLLDVGSRIGAVLYGAYETTDVKHIIGVEMNEELCRIQRKIIKKYSMGERISIVHDDINDCVDVIKSADIIVLHNVFEYFLSEEDQRTTWLNLRKTINKGTILVTVPSVVESISFDDNLMVDMDVIGWLKPMTVNFDANMTLDDDQLADMQTMYFYQVI